MDGLEAVLADVLTAEPEESLPHAYREPSKGALHLLRRRDFRLTYAAIATSELGYAFQYIALMWFALEVAGPAGVLVVRLADSVPALLFGLHGGLLADRLERRRTMIAADLFRGAVLIPVAIAGLAGNLPLWGLVLAAFLLTAATSYFDPAYGALLPALVSRAHVQEANALVRASADAINVGGWALAAGLLLFMPLSVLFAINAATFFVSAALISRIHPRPAPSAAEGTAWTQVKEGINALALLPVLAVAVAALGIAVTIESGTWMVGVPELVRSELGHGAGGFSLVMVGYAAGSIAGGIYLARRPVRRKAYASLVAWTLYLPAYLLMGLAGTLTVAILGALCAGIGQGSSIVLLNSAAQEQVPDRVLGRVMGLIGLVHRGAHATGLIFVSPLFAFFSPEADLRRGGPCRPAHRHRRSRLRPRAQSSRRRSSSTWRESKPSILSRLPAASTAAPAGIRPTSSLPATSAPRASTSATIVATIVCRAAASQSVTFMLTCTSPAFGRSSPSARTPGKPPSRSRTRAAISRAVSTVAPRRLTLKAMSGRRTPMRTPPAVGCRVAGPRSGASSPESIRR